MAAVQTLRLVFANAEDKLVSINLQNPAAGLDESTVGAVMDDIVTKNIFQTGGGNITSKVKAEIVTREVTEIGDWS